MSSFWNTRWAEPAAIYGDEPNVFLAENIGLLPEKGKVVCLADGDGRNGRWLAAQGFDVTGVDSSAVAVAKANAVGVAGYRAVEADLSDWPVPPCDAVVSIYAHLPPALRQQVHRRCWEALSPGGIFLLEAFTPAQLSRSSGGPKDEALLYRASLFHEDLPGAHFLHLEECSIELREGTYHVGPAEVIRVIARKP